MRIARNPSADGTKANLVVTVGPDSDTGEGIVLSGHMDVMPAEESDWRSDPFSLTDVGDRLAGRGAADMKGFLALATNRLAVADVASFRHPLTLLFTYDEEIGTLGARRFGETFEERGRLPRAVVIGEPTELQVVRAHKGMVRYRLAFAGRAAHSGYPHIGRSAIEPAARAIVALADLRRTMEAERPPHGDLFPEVPFTALNVGVVQGGTAANVIPDRCDIDVGVRVLPGQTASGIGDRIMHAVRGAVAEPFAFECVTESPPMMLDEDAAIHRRLCEVTGQRGSRSVMFATDAGWLQRAGFECVVFGPGDIREAHRANESLPVAEFHRAGEVLDALIRRSCLER